MNTIQSKLKLHLFAFLMISSVSADAYIGPGLGLGTIGAVLGILAAIVLAIIGIVWYPLKRMIKKRRAQKQEAETMKNKKLD